MDTESTVTLNTTMSAQEQAKLRMTADSYNKELAAKVGHSTQQTLGKDDFLKLFITQLANQDPTSPMDNTEFSAQMAQFSTLEQMTNMNVNFERMNNMLSSSQAVNTLGKTVNIDLGDTSITGTVSGVTYGNNPQVQVGNMLYDMKQITAVYGN